MGLPSIIELSKNGDPEELGKQLLLGDVNLDLQDEDYGQTAISWASKEGHGEVVALLLSHGAKPNVPDNGGNMPVDWACTNRHHEIAKLLLSKITESQDVLHRARSGQSVLSVAAMCGAVIDMRRFLEMPDVEIDSRDENGWTPLMFAASHGHKEAAETLLDAGADPSLRDDDGREALYHAAENGRTQVVELLAFKGSDIDGNEFGRPLIGAASNGHTATIEALLSAGASPALSDGEGETPLSEATENGHTSAIRGLILSMGNIWIQVVSSQEVGMKGVAIIAFAAAASGIPEVWESLPDKAEHVAAKGRNGFTALHYAAKFGLLNASKLLIFEGSDINARDDAGQSPLIRASSQGHLPTVKLLLDQGADPNLRDHEYQKTPLMFAVENGQHDVLKYLCDCENTDVNATATDYYDFTALLFAARCNNPICVSILLEYGADIEKADSCWGQTPLAWATEDDNVEVAKLLIQAGANLYATNHAGLSPTMFACMGSTKLLQVCIEEPALWSTSGEEPTPRARVIENGLRYAYETINEDVLGLVLRSEEYLNSTDEHGRNVLSLAAELGSKREIEELCKKDLYFDQKDNGGRTPLSWAAGRDDEDFVSILLTREEVTTSFDVPDNRGRTPLSWAAGNGCHAAVQSLLQKKAVVDNKDKKSRTPLSWAAAGGHQAILTLLLEKDAKVDFEDIFKRTPLSWAAENGNQEAVSVLLKHGAVADCMDVYRRTPLSWAAGGGHASVIKTLLNINQGKENSIPVEAKGGSRKVKEHAFSKEGQSTRTATRSTVANPGKKTLVVKVNSQDWASRTPLYYAACAGHKNAVKALLDRGADPGMTISDLSGNITLVELLGKLIRQSTMRGDTSCGPASPSPIPGATSPEPATLADVREMLILREFIEVKPLEGSSGVDKVFTATVMHLPREKEGDMLLGRPSVDYLLRAGPSKQRLGDTDSSCRWMHLPANNMKWVEMLMARHFMSWEDTKTWKLNAALKEKLWLGQKHLPCNGAYHARFMRPACHSIDFPQDGVDPSWVKSSPTSNSNGTILFMPFLHWEKQDEFEKLKKILEQKQRLRLGETKNEAPAASSMNFNDLDVTEKLYWMYLDEEHPLHVRRTLDQFYYHTFPNTDERDKDQTILRYYHNHGLSKEGLKPVLTMVDQLWMWVLPEYGQSPPTIITAFPQRSNRMASSESESMTALIWTIIQRARGLSVKTSHELAQVIASECCRIYLDATSDRSEAIQFLEIYTTSIGEIVSVSLPLAKKCAHYVQSQTDRETKRFRKFQENIKSLTSHNADPTPCPGSSERPTPKTAPSSDDSDVLRELVAIKDDIEDLRQIKDIREELSIMSSLFHVQKEVLQVMDHKFKDDRATANQHSRASSSASPCTSPASSLSIPSGFTAGLKERVFHSPTLTAVNRNIAEVQRLEVFAERTVTAIQQLLDLKHKQANLLEEQLARELTSGILKLNNETSSQGKTIMYFTVATIVFLPLSFIASFLALEISEFPWLDDKLPVSFVLPILFGVSVAVVVPAVTMAFNPEKTESMVKFFKSTYNRISKRKEDGKPRGSGGSLV